ncbi:hypothetical protein AB1K91_05195 [Terribacillus sp. 179-K 1B1 HS]|uniref:hypothetical protein n=1 Tax=Terribacillus sp. 179-K 1B1 HS TaxID=3142388 RepID=UPI0039A2A90E
MAKAMDLETAKRIVSEHYETVILVNEKLSDCKVIHKGNSLQDLSNLRLYISPVTGVNMSIKQTYTPTKNMMLLNMAPTTRVRQLHGKREVVHRSSEQKHDPNKWHCECGEENDYRDSKQRVKKKATEHQCGVCLQWVKVESERVAG